MKFIGRNDLPTVKIQNNAGLQFEFFSHGALFQILAKDIMVNQVLGHPLDGSLNNLFVRVKGAKEIAYAPLMGPQFQGSFLVGSSSATWTGEALGLSYVCRLQLDDSELCWVWTVELTNAQNQAVKVDLVYGQDMGIAHEGAVRVNEAYCSQYIDHTVFSDDAGFVICSRQNQKTAHGHPWLVQGCLQKTVGYVTDGFDFFGTGYKADRTIEALTKDVLPNRRYQYEMAYAGLQTETVALNSGESVKTQFFAHLTLDHAAATSDADKALVTQVKAAAQRVASCAVPAEQKQSVLPQSLFASPDVLVGADLTEADLALYFPGVRRHEEYVQEQLGSFFHGDSAYVCLKAKELVLERPHGHVVRSGHAVFPHEDILSTTSYMYGLFHSHLTIGNTSFNKLLSITRTPLNILPSSGQRIFVKQADGSWALLGMPSAYELLPSSSRWIYKLADCVIEVLAWVAVDSARASLSVRVIKGDAKEFLLSHHLILGNNEWDAPGSFEADAKTGTVIFTPDTTSMLAQHYPETLFGLVVAAPDQIAAIGGDELLWADGQARKLPYCVLTTKAVSSFELSFTGDVLSATRAKELISGLNGQAVSFEQDEVLSAEFWAKLSNHFSFEHSDRGVVKINDMTKWYVHNGMIHYTTPHGLEQFSGAAWGVRDVCQGPVELLLATKNCAPVRDILKLVFEQQYVDSGDWPQWFMFDRYVKIQHAESHGDIIVWPLKALASYMEASADFSILDEVVRYTDSKTFERVEPAETIYDHVLKTLDTIESRFIKGTSLSCYGEGDWDDTLQPADPSMRSQMVSAWTVSLTYQVVTRLSKAMALAERADLSDRLSLLAGRIAKDFNHYLMPQGISSGFAYFHSLDQVDYMLHPLDTKTGLKYRLLPMTRSMIAELFTPEQAQQHLALIDEHFACPDGVRLMDTTVEYKGGVRKFFRRAEEAANFGREIGLQYVHAHIRYIEAMCKLGLAERAYKAICQIIPIDIQSDVPNALLRQSNAYFSSSDGAFADRYAARAGYAKLRSGDVPVKGGWRVYSSGPGIILNQIVANFFGVRESFGRVVFDPILPTALDGIVIRMLLEGKRVKIAYHVASAQGAKVSSVKVNGQDMRLQYEDNPYRTGGALVFKEDIAAALTDADNQIEVTVS